MSVFIFGDVQQASSGWSWEGHWYFAKNRSQDASFSYRKREGGVQRELVEYVSFMNEVRVERVVKKSKKSKWNKSRKGGGRGEVVVTEEKREESRDLPQDSSEEAVVKNTEEELSKEKIEEKSEIYTSEEKEKSTTDEIMNDENNARDVNDHTSSMKEEISSEIPYDGPIIIPPRHPLFGVWEGSFTLPVKTNNHGTRGERLEVEIVEETFFFYAFDGEHIKPEEPSTVQVEASDEVKEVDNNKQNQDALSASNYVDPVPGLEQLPYPPRWTAAYIRELYSADRNDRKSQGTGPEQEARIDDLANASSGGPESPTVEYLSTSAPKAMKKEVSFNDVDTVSQSKTDQDKKKLGDVNPTDKTKTSEDGNNIKVSMNTDGDTYQDVNSKNSGMSDSIKPEVTAITPRFAQNQSTPNSSMLIPPHHDGEVMIVGFGQNKYGRFSLAGSYNPRTGTLRCERKYMLTKPLPPIRKLPRLSGDAESGASKRPVRTKRAYSIDMDIADYAAPTSGKRKRTSSLATLESTYGPDDALDSSSSSKRGRKKGQINSTRTQVMTASQHQIILNKIAEKEFYHRAFLDPATGEVYEGEWLNGMRNGFGVVLYPDGTLYEGSWLNNKEHGPAGLWMTGAREILYSGEWSEGKIHGTGTYYFPSGDIYVGEFKEGVRHGKGLYTLANGCSYDGDWRDNLRHGKGVFQWTDGSEYSGDWELGQRSGRGELHLSNNLTYSGTWACNLMDGRGVLVYPDGQEYKGIFKNGLREGRGSLSFPEGAMYEGRFREDILDGQGTLKITKSVPGGTDGEVFIPLDNLADIRRIHYKSGFGGDAHH